MGARKQPNSEADDYRVLHDGPLAVVLDTWASASEPAPSGVVEKYAVVLPYEGLFGFRVGSRSSLFDAQKTLFVTAGREYTDSHPVVGVGHACLVLRPSEALLEDLFGSWAPMLHAGFQRMSAPASTRLRIQAQRLRRMSSGSNHALRDEEWVLEALREAASPPSERLDDTPRIVDRARQVLHAFSSERLSLARIASEVGVSPAYLTQAFTRSEGQPLYRYQLGLRLNRALVELPHCNDLTGLALDLGFSSHSHFTSAFRTSFGLSPSHYRAAARRDRTTIRI